MAELCEFRIFHGASVVPVTDDLLKHCTYEICNDSEAKATTAAGETPTVSDVNEAVVESGE